MANSGIKRKPITKLSVFTIIIFLISLTLIIVASKTTIAEIRNEEGFYSYSASERKNFLYFEVTIEHSSGSLIWREEFRTDPFHFFSGESATITIRDSSNKVVNQNFRDGKYVAVSQSRQISVNVSEPFYCYMYEIDIVIYKYEPIMPIISSFAIIFTLFTIISISIFIARKNRKSISNQLSTDSQPEEEIVYNYIIVKEEPPEGAICAISRTTLDSSDQILRCPKCKSYFIRHYLIGWLQTSSKCPICQVNLRYTKRF